MIVTSRQGVISRTMLMAVVVGLVLSALPACDQAPPSAPTPRGNVDVTLMLTPGQTRPVEGLDAPLSITFTAVQARNVCGPSACLAIFIPLVVLDITGESAAPSQRKLALPSTLATDDVPSVTTVGGLQIELTALEPTFNAPLDYRASFRVRSSFR